MHTRYDTRIFLKECRSLAKNKNYSVNLVVADGKGDEVKDGVNIIDVGSKARGRISRMKITVKKVYQKSVEMDSDIYHLHDPELMLIGLKLKKLGKKVIYDIHENTYLQILTKEWMPLSLRKIISISFKKFEYYCCSKYELLIVPQKTMLTKYINLKKTIVINNFPLKNRNINFKKKRINKYHLLYSGTISEARGLWNMLELIVEITKYNKKYRLILAGNINNGLLKKAEQHIGWKHTSYLGNLENNEIYRIYGQNSLGLILFDNVGQYYMAYSLKLFEYMQNGMFVIMPKFGDWKDFNFKFNVGLNVDTNDYKKMAIDIHALTENVIKTFGENNIKLVNSKFSWESQETKLLHEYEVVANETRT